MSNIGFMESCAVHIEALYNYYMKNPKLKPSKAEKESYIKIITELDNMYKYGEIEDKKNTKSCFLKF